MLDRNGIVIRRRIDDAGWTAEYSIVAIFVVARNGKIFSSTWRSDHGLRNPAHRANKAYSRTCRQVC